VFCHSVELLSRKEGITIVGDGEVLPPMLILQASTTSTNGTRLMSCLMSMQLLHLLLATPTIRSQLSGSSTLRCTQPSDRLAHTDSLSLMATAHTSQSSFLTTLMSTVLFPSLYQLTRHTTYSHATW
jgi:hypothetical protein